MRSSSTRVHVRWARRAVTAAAVVAVLAAVAVVPAAAAAPELYEPATVSKLTAPSAAAAAVEISKARFDSDDARWGVLSRDDVFADSLAGSPLTGDGPLLLTNSDRLDSAVRAELQRVLRPGATVYLLGGDAALSASVESAVRSAGFAPRRLSGARREATSAAIALEAHARLGETSRVVVARADNWADSITGGAWAAERGVPVLLTRSDRVSDDIKPVLADLAPSQTIVLGGEAAVSRRAFNELPNARRVAGPNRDATAAAIASELWGSQSRYTLIDGWSAHAWGYGLAAAGLAADANAPLVTTSPTSAMPRVTSGLAKGTSVLAVAKSTSGWDLRALDATAPVRESFEACDFYSADDAESVFGGSYQKVQDRDTGVCYYSPYAPGPDPIVRIDHESNLGYFKWTYADVFVRMDIGDEAVFGSHDFGTYHFNAVAVRVGDRTMAWKVNTPSAPSATLRAHMTAVAERAVPLLGG